MSFTPLNAIGAFLAVARHKSFSGAARHLGVSTSALSQAVRQLESRVGVPLLLRTSRSVALTQAGERLLADAGPAVDQALESLKSITAQPGEIVGRVRLSVPSFAENLVLAELIPHFIKRHPKIEVDVRVDNRFVDIVAEGLDAGIRLSEAIDRDMVQLRLSPTGRFVIAGAPSYLKRCGEPKKVADLLQHDCIGFRFENTGERWPWELERGKRTWRVPVRGPVTLTNARDLYVRLAIEGIGLIYAYEPSIADELARGALRIVLEPYACEVPGLFLYFPSRAQVSPALRAFVEVAHEFARRA